MFEDNQGYMTIFRPTRVILARRPCLGKTNKPSTAFSVPTAATETSHDQLSTGEFFSPLALL